jgi:hypothetical protein
MKGGRNLGLESTAVCLAAGVGPARLAAVPALLVATAAYAVLAWLRLRRIGQL